MNKFYELPSGSASGEWARRGSTILVFLEETPPEGLSFEFETSQPTLRLRSRGSAVKTLQARLRAVGFDRGPLDWIFGFRTDSVVRAFQRARAIQVDGIVGPQTWAKLYAPIAAAG
jgi:peptidoglycan hydrolase-like protein with peptidoglycan-binding domain